MAQNYTIKQGDTLGAIAQKFGTKVSDITGFRSGDPDLIFPGEKITINTPSLTQEEATGMDITELSKRLATEDTGVVGGEAQERATTLRSELAPDYTLKDGVDFNKFQTDLTESTTKKEEAFEKLQGFRTSRYDELREERGLENSRLEIDSLDEQIALKRSERDASIAKAKKNPGASAATITGEVRGITDQLNAGINNLIEQRNSKAGSYNTTLGEIDRIVGQEAGDLEAELGFFTEAETGARGSLTAYNEAVLDELRRTEDREYDLASELRGFEQAIELARIRGVGTDSGTTYQLKFDPITGESFLFNPDTGVVESPEDVQLDESTTVINENIAPDTQAGAQKSDGGFFSGLWKSIEDKFGYKGE